MARHPFYSGTKLQTIYESLQQQKKEVDQDVVDQLAQLACDDKAALKPLIRKGRQVLREYFYASGYHQKLTSLGIGILFYGSLQYNDPRNLDADLLVIAHKKTNFQQVPVNEIHNEVIQLWDREVVAGPQAEPHIGWVALDTFNNIPLAIKKSPQIFDMNAMELSQLITGMLLFPEDKEWIGQMRVEARKVAEADALVCAIVNAELQGCLEVRTERRAV